MLFHCLAYDEQERRLHDVQEICHVLRDMFDESKLHIEHTPDGHAVTDEHGRLYHAVVTVLATGDKFPIFFQHDAAENDYDFMVNREWFCGSIRWIPLQLDMKIRDSFEAEYHRWAERQWKSHLERKSAWLAPVVPLVRKAA